MFVIFLFSWFWLKLVQNYIFLSKPQLIRKQFFKVKTFAFLLKHSRLIRIEKYFNFANTPYRQKPSKLVDKEHKILAFYFKNIYTWFVV